MRASIDIVSVNVGLPSPIGERRGEIIYSSINKRPVIADHIYLTPTGLSGDQQVETGFKSSGDQLHGGHEMALYAYPQQHYDRWREEAPEGDFHSGCLGENLAIIGVTEDDVMIGDVWLWGSSRLQVTKPRSPCHKLDLFHPGALPMRRMVKNGLCGWYLRVLNPGLVPTQGTIEVIERATDSESIADRFRRKERPAVSN